MGYRSCLRLNQASGLRLAANSNYSVMPAVVLMERLPKESSRLLRSLLRPVAVVWKVNRCN